MGLKPRSFRVPRPAWLALRTALGLSVAALALFDGPGLFLSPGQALAAAFAPGPHASDPRFGVSLSLALWAGLALASVAARALRREPRA